MTALAFALDVVVIAVFAHTAVNAIVLQRPPRGACVEELVSILMPMRDEASRLEPSLRSVVAQRGLARREILVYDDDSGDATAAVASSVAGEAVAVLSGGDLPAGWLGKPHACWQLAHAAAGTVLVFVDADVVLAPDAVAGAVSLLRDEGLAFVSPYPRQLAGSWLERLVQPLLQWSWLAFLPLRVAQRSSRPALAAANGQFLVVRRTAYECAGGHVPDAALDDLALLRAIKRSGGRGTIVDGSELASCRMYTGWRDVRDGYAKSLWSAFGSTPGAAGVLTLLGIAYLVPPLAMMRGSRAGAVGYAAAVAGRVVTARRTGGRAVPDAFAHPVSIATLGYLTVRSHVLHRRGALRWKGRPIS
jgi:cellulose synthase/poly-beta-1,6-N-acetylglucosamine synthase-like glycosyltransferase